MMMRLAFLGQNGRASEALELSLVRARQALACPFSSSDEFEAAVIKSRREAGAYGPTARQRRLYWGAALTALLAMLLIVV